jgi:hypothetical protein
MLTGKCRRLIKNLQYTTDSYSLYPAHNNNNNNNNNNNMLFIPYKQNSQFGNNIY